MSLARDDALTNGFCQMAPHGRRPIAEHSRPLDSPGRKG